MTTENKSKIRFLIWIFPAAAAAVIFCFSAQPGDESAVLSGRLAEIALRAAEWLGIGRDLDREEEIELLTVILRKGAHITEYVILCISLLAAFFCSQRRKTGRPWIVLGIVFLYACSDEFHQLFVAGRSGKFTDVLIDCIGAAVLCILLAVRRRRRRRPASGIRRGNSDGTAAGTGNAEKR